MTEVARAVGRVTWAAMENRPWPADMPFTIASPDGQPRIAQSGEQTLTPPVRVLCFYAEVTASFVTPPPAGTPDRSLELGLLLCSGGVRVVEIDGDPPHPGVALGPGLAGLGRTASEVLATIASGRGQELLLRESDREAVGGSALFDRAMREQVRPEQLAEVQREIAQRGQPTSFDLDDMGIIALDTRGPIGFRLDLEHGPNGFVLDGPPFVRIQRFE